MEEFGGTIKLGKPWAKNVLRRMGFSKRKANSKAKTLPHDFNVLAVFDRYKISSVYGRNP